MSTTNTIDKKYTIIKNENIKDFLFNNDDISTMYAAIADGEVIAPFVGTIKDAIKEFPNCDFIPVTLDNSPFIVGKYYTDKTGKGI